MVFLARFWSKVRFSKQPPSETCKPLDVVGSRCCDSTRLPSSSHLLDEVSLRLNTGPPESGRSAVNSTGRPGNEREADWLEQSHVSQTAQHHTTQHNTWTSTINTVNGVVELLEHGQPTLFRLLHICEFGMLQKKKKKNGILGTFLGLMN